MPAEKEIKEEEKVEEEKLKAEKEEEKLLKEKEKEEKKSTVAGFVGFKPSMSMFSSANVGGAGKIIGIGVLIAVILFLAFFIFGLFAAMPLYWLMIAIGIILFFYVLLFKRKVGAAVMILIIFGGLGYGAWYMQYTSFGKQITGQVQVGGIGAIQGFRTLTGPLNVMSQIFTGTYNPENLWRSDTIESQYQTVADVGVILSDVNPIRDKFDVSQPPVIQGKINAVAFPGQTATATISATCSPAPGSTTACASEDWPCTPSTFSSIREVRNRFFSCASPAAQSAEGVFSVDVSATAKDTWTVAGKQFVFANPNATITLENPLQTWGISTDSLKSWQKGDAFLSLGIGVSGEPDYLDAGSNVPYFLGVHIENPSSNTGTANLNTVDLFLPKALFNNDCNAAANSDFKTCKDAGDLSKLGLKTTAPLCDCTASFAYGETLNPGDSRTALLKLVIDKKLLYGADFGTFFTLATAKYNYVNKQLIAVTVEQIVPS
jgi:hypothetical protein